LHETVAFVTHEVTNKYKCTIDQEMVWALLHTLWADSACALTR